MQVTNKVHEEKKKKNKEHNCIYELEPLEGDYPDKICSKSPGTILHSFLLYSVNALLKLLT